MSATVTPIKANTNNYCWMRGLEIRLYSKLYKVQPLIFGSAKVKNFVWNDNFAHTLEREYISDQLSISVKGTKKLSALEDNGVCEISNLTYSAISQIILGQYYKIEIWAGYRTQADLQCFMRGEIAYISNEIVMRRDHKCYIIFASELVAGYSQRRINFNLNSGINLYAAMRYIFLTSGINASLLPESLKNEVYTEIQSKWGTPATLAETLANNSINYTISSDSALDGNLVDCSTLNDKRWIRIDANTISFRKGNPRVNSDGLSISLLPTFNFKTGDIIIIDNSIVNVNETSLQGVQSNFSANYIDTTFVHSDTPQLGAYMIRQIDFAFENRGETFEVNILARAVSIIVNTLGVNY